jgi:hypothetical protein
VDAVIALIVIMSIQTMLIMSNRCDNRNSCNGEEIVGAKLSKVFLLIRRSREVFRGF